jgi:hypothetical protein
MKCNSVITLFAVFFVWALGFIVGVSLGAHLGSRDKKNEMQEDAVKNGHAHYDPKTRQFTWNDEVKK